MWQTLSDRCKLRLHLALAHLATARLAQIASGYALRRAASTSWRATRQPSTIHPARRSNAQHGRFQPDALRFLQIAKDSRAAADYGRAHRMDAVA